MIMTDKLSFLSLGGFRVGRTAPGPLLHDEEGAQRPHNEARPERPKPFEILKVD